MKTLSFQFPHKHYIRSALHSVIPGIKIRGIHYQLYPSFFGFVFIGMLVALLVGSISHNNNLGYLITFLLGSVFLVSLLHTYRNIQGIEVLAHNAPPVFAGQNARFTLHLTAKKNDRFGIEVSLDNSPRITTNFFVKKSEPVSLFLPAIKRGVLEVNKLTLSTSYPLGLFHLSMQSRIMLTCLVYPKPLRNVLDSNKPAGDNEKQAPQQKTGGRDFTGLQQYVPGDSLQRIHWKSLASGKGLHSKQFEDSGLGSLVFSLKDLKGSDLESKLARLSYLVLTADSQGLAYGLQLDQPVIGPAKGAGHKIACLKALALY